MTTTLQVRRTMCRTCIYRDDSPLDLEQLEAQVADDHMPGFFKGYRACHHHRGRGVTVCCRGFWEAHKDSFTLGQLAQRLGLVEFSNDGETE